MAMPEVVSGMANWIDETLSTSKLGDARLVPRAKLMIRRMAENTSGSISPDDAGGRGEEGGVPAVVFGEHGSGSGPEGDE